MRQHKNTSAAPSEDSNRSIEVPTQRVVKWPAGGPFAAAKKARGRLPSLSLANLRFADDVPEPVRYTTGNGKYDSLFERLTRDGQSVTGIPAEYTGALQHAAKKFLERRPALAAKSILRVARIDASTCGIWRKAKEAGK